MSTQSIQVASPLAPDLESLNKLNKLIVDSGQYTNFGDLVKRLENELCQELGVKYLRLVNNGTMALQVILSLFAKKDKKYVITTPFTFPATASAIVMAGFEPYFVDINPQTLNIDVDKVITALEKIGHQVAALLPVHVFGNPASPIEFQNICNRYEIPLLYDACHTFGASYLNKALSSYGDASAMSFHPTKIFHTGEGGGVVVETSENYALTKELVNFGFGAQGQINHISFNAKLSEFNAAIGLSVIGRVAGELKKRKQIARRYLEKLSGIQTIRYQEVPDGYQNNNQYFPILMSNSIRERVVTLLNENNVFPRKYFSPSLPEAAVYKGYSPLDCQNSNRLSKEVLCLPLYGSLTNESVDFISDLVIQATAC